jgi:hypothetical protein
MTDLSLFIVYFSIYIILLLSRITGFSLICLSLGLGGLMLSPY